MARDASRLARLKAGRRAVVTIDWPGRPGERVGLRPLVGQESVAARQAALEAVSSTPSQGWAALAVRELYEEELSYQLLFYSMVDPVSGEPFAASANEVKQLVELDEAAQLLEAAQRDPALDEMNPEQLAEEADALGEALAPGTPSSSSSGPPPETSSAFRVRSAPTGSSCTSSRCSAPEPSTSQVPPRRRTATTSPPADRLDASSPGSSTPT